MKTRIKELRACYNLAQRISHGKSVYDERLSSSSRKGTTTPSLQLAYDIAKALQTTIDNLFEFDE